MSGPPIFDKKLDIKERLRVKMFQDCVGVVWWFGSFSPSLWLSGVVGCWRSDFPEVAEQVVLGQDLQMRILLSRLYNRDSRRSGKHKKLRRGVLVFYSLFSLFMPRILPTPSSPQRFPSDTTLLRRYPVVCCSHTATTKGVIRRPTR